MSRIKRKSTKYKYVYLYHKQSSNSKFVWTASYNKKVKHFTEEKDAAKWVDLRLIEEGKEPVKC